MGRRTGPPALRRAKKLKDSTLDGADIDVVRCFDRIGESGNLLAAQVSFHDAGMHVAFTTDCWRIAKKLCHCANGHFDIRLCLFVSFELSLHVESQRCQQRSRPCAEVFCRKIRARYFAQIIIYILGCHVPDLAILLHILKQILSRHILALRNDFRDSAIRHVHLVLAATFSTEPKT